MLKSSNSNRPALYTCTDGAIRRRPQAGALAAAHRPGMMAALLLLVWFFTLPGFFAAGPAIPGASITTMDRCSALPAAAVRKTRFQWHLSEEGQLINQLTGLCLTVGCDQVRWLRAMLTKLETFPCETYLCVLT